MWKSWLDDVVKANSSFADILGMLRELEIIDPFLRKMLGKLMQAKTHQ